MLINRSLKSEANLEKWDGKSICIQMRDHTILQRLKQKYNIRRKTYEINIRPKHYK